MMLLLPLFVVVVVVVLSSSFVVVRRSSFVVTVAFVVRRCRRRPSLLGSVADAADAAGSDTILAMTAAVVAVIAAVTMIMDVGGGDTARWWHFSMMISFLNGRVALAPLLFFTRVAAKLEKRCRSTIHCPLDSSSVTTSSFVFEEHRSTFFPCFKAEERDGEYLVAAPGPHDAKHIQDSFSVVAAKSAAIVSTTMPTPSTRTHGRDAMGTGTIRPGFAGYCAVQGF